jgi:hypothetical protein
LAVLNAECGVGSKLKVKELGVASTLFTALIYKEVAVFKERKRTDFFQLSEIKATKETKLKQMP